MTLQIEQFQNNFFYYTFEESYTRTLTNWLFETEEVTFPPVPTSDRIYSLIDQCMKLRGMTPKFMRAILLLAASHRQLVIPSETTFKDRFFVRSEDSCVQIEIFSDQQHVLKMRVPQSYNEMIEAFAEGGNLFAPPVLDLIYEITPEDGAISYGFNDLIALWKVKEDLNQQKAIELVRSLLHSKSPDAAQVGLLLHDLLRIMVGIPTETGAVLSALPLVLAQSNQRKWCLQLLENLGDNLKENKELFQDLKLTVSEDSEQLQEELTDKVKSYSKQQFFDVTIVNQISDRISHWRELKKKLEEFNQAFKTENSEKFETILKSLKPSSSLYEELGERAVYYYLDRKRRDLSLKIALNIPKWFHRYSLKVLKGCSDNIKLVSACEAACKYIAVDKALLYFSVLALQINASHEELTFVRLAKRITHCMKSLPLSLRFTWNPARQNLFRNIAKAPNPIVRLSYENRVILRGYSEL